MTITNEKSPTENNIPTTCIVNFGKGNGVGRVNTSTLFQTHHGELYYQKKEENLNLFDLRDGSEEEEQKIPTKDHR